MTIAIIILTAILWLASYLAVVTCTRQALRIGWAAAALTAYPIWWLLQILLANALSLFHALTQANLILCASGMVISALLLSRRFRRDEEPVTILPTLLRPCAWEIALIGGILLCSAVAIFLYPSKVFDTTTYHLPTIATWVQQHSMDPYPTFCDRQVTRSHAGTIQQFWVIGMAHADPLGEIPNLLACVMLALSVWCITRRWRLPLPLCLTATVSIWAIPQIVHASLSCKDDLLLTAAIMCGLYCLLIAFEHGQPARHWYAALAGACIALVFGAKVPGLAFGTALLFTSAVYAFRKHRWYTLRWMIDADWILITVLLAGLPVFILKYIFTARHFGVLWPEQWTEVRKPSIPVLYPLWYYFRLLIAPFHHGIDADHDNSNYGVWFALVTFPAFV